MSLVSALIISVFGIVIYNGQTNEAVQVTSSNNWGLGFHTDGLAPRADIEKEEIELYDAYYIGNETFKKIYLTFDAGYENGNTETILDILKEKNVKATFFLVGNYLETQPDLVKRMVEEGHLVGNHTYHHLDMSVIGEKEKFQDEIQSLEVLYQEITGKEMIKLYRPPQGKYSIDNLQNAKELGYKTFFWSLAYMDWDENNQPTKEEAMNKLLKRIHPGAIVLLHSTSSTNANILDELITEWENLGYEFGSLDEF
ncbi:MAG: polysaccharide deacetylase family protein [Lachnospiraceae bacterium]